MHRSPRISRQGTFETDPADFVSGDSIRRGNIQFPVINESSNKAEPRPQAQTTPPDHVTGKEGLHSKASAAETAEPPHQTAAEATHKVDSGRTFVEAAATNDVAGSSGNAGQSDKNEPFVKREPPKKKVEPGKNSRRRSLSKSSSEEAKTSTVVREKSLVNASSVEADSPQRVRGTDQDRPPKEPERGKVPSSEDRESRTQAAWLQSGERAEDRPAAPSPQPREEQPPVIASKPPESTHRPPDPSGPSRNRSNSDAMADTAARRRSLARANTRKSDLQPSDFPGRYSPVRTPDREVRGRGNSASRTHKVRDAGEETYENVRAERDSLLRSEAAYKKRIKLLEEDSKQFLKKIEEISQENTLLRDRMEMMDSNPRAAAPAPAKASSSEEEGLSRREFEKLKKENAGLKETVLQLERECSQLNRSNKKLHSETLLDQDKIRDREYLLNTNTELTQKVKEQQKKIQDLEKEKESMAKSLTIMESGQLAKADDLRTENKKLEAELRNQQKANEEAEDKVKALKSENKTLSEALAKKREELDELMRALKSDESAAEDLKKTKLELEAVTNTLARVEKEKDVSRAKEVEASAEKEKLAKELSEVKVSLKEVKVGSGEKEKVAINLRSQLDKLKAEKEESQKKIEQLTAENAEMRQLRTEVANLKVKVRTLSSDLSSSKDVNRKLERDNEEKQAEIERLQRQLNREREDQERLHKELDGRLADNEEVQRLRQALEAERSRHKEIDEDMERKKQDIARLEQHTFEMNMKVEALNNKMKEVEEERRQELERSLKMSDIELANKQLSEENARLKHAMVERNFENTAHRSDKQHLMTRLELLEQRQEDSEIQVKQMRGWMNGVNKHKQAPTTEIVVATTTTSTNGRSPRAKSPSTNGMGRRSRKTGGGAASRASKAVTYEDVRMNDVKQLDIALDDASSTPSLPPIEEVRLTKPITYTNGYYQMYKNKRRLIQSRR